MHFDVSARELVEVPALGGERLLDRRLELGQRRARYPLHLNVHESHAVRAAHLCDRRRIARVDLELPGLVGTADRQCALLGDETVGVHRTVQPDKTEDQE